MKCQYMSLNKEFSLYAVAKQHSRLQYYIGEQERTNRIADKTNKRTTNITNKGLSNQVNIGKSEEVKSILSLNCE